MKQAVVAIAALLLLMLATNPSVEQHRDEFNEFVGERSGLAAGLGLGRLGSMMLSYESYGVASVTRMGDEVVGFGVLGMVFIQEPGDR